MNLAEWLILRRLALPLQSIYLQCVKMLSNWWCGHYLLLFMFLVMLSLHCVGFERLVKSLAFFFPAYVLFGDVQTTWISSTPGFGSFIAHWPKWDFKETLFLCQPCMLLDRICWIYKSDFDLYYLAEGQISFTLIVWKDAGQSYLCILFNKKSCSQLLTLQAWVDAGRVILVCYYGSLSL